MNTEVKKSSSKAWIAVIAGVLFGVVFLGLLLLSVKNDSRDVQNYAKTWYGDKSASMPMSKDGKMQMDQESDMQHHHH